MESASVLPARDFNYSDQLLKLRGDSAKRPAVQFFGLNRQQRSYRKIAIKEQVDVLSFTGNVLQRDGKPRLHTHCDHR